MLASAQDALHCLFIKRGDPLHARCSADVAALPVVNPELVRIEGIEHHAEMVRFLEDDFQVFLDAPGFPGQPDVIERQ